MKHTDISKILITLFAVVLCFGPVGLADPIGTAFTYQGRLIDANQAADGLYDFQFKLYDANGGGNKLGTDVNKPNIDVIDGYFTAELDFGSAFDGNNRWLEIGVRPGVQSDPCAYSLLSPRQKITPTPYALAMRGILLNTNNTFTGLYAGYNNTTGSQNTFSGSRAGYSNTTGHDNTFTGYYAGRANTTGYWNSAVGSFALYANTTGHDNSVLGYSALYGNTGNLNLAVGNYAGYSNTMGNGNVFLGCGAGYSEHGSNKLYIANSAADANTLIYGDFSAGKVSIGTKNMYAKFYVANTDPSIGASIRGDTPPNLNGIYHAGEFIAAGPNSIGVYGSGGGGPMGYDFYAGGPGVDYGSSSSIRWKRNIQPINEPLDKVAQLSGVYFDWDAEHGGRHAVGMVAEEVGKVLPEIVNYEPNGQYATGMDYGKLTPLLVEAVKALKTEVDQLRQQNTDKDAAIKTLEDTNRDLQIRIAKVEKLIAQSEPKPIGGIK